ncbi:MAG: glycosyltransferase [Solirubrobacteraceae bacterium]
MLHVYKDVYPPVAGGIEKHIDVLRRHMPEVRSDVLVCSGSRHTSRRPTSHGEEIKVGELGRLLAVPVAPTFPFHLVRQRPDVVHLHMPYPLGELSAILVGRGVRVVVSYHADIVRQAALEPIYRPFLRWWFRRAAAVIVGSHRLVETSPYLDGLDDRIDVVPYGVDTQLIARGRAAGAKAAKIRARFGTPLILTVGRLVSYKGYENLVAAAHELHASLISVGVGPLEGELKDQALGDNRIHFVGAVSDEDLPAYLRAADVFALPSTTRAESFGIATLEAQALGVPAVITDVGTGTIEAVDPGLTGLVVPPGDVQALRDALQRLLSDPAGRARMGRAAAARVERDRTAAHQAARVLEIYRRVVSTP